MCGDFDMVGKLEPGCALSSVGAFFSTAGAGMFDRWVGECLRRCVKLDADAVGRMVAAACGLVDGVASAHPSMVERCVNMRTALRRFGESASEFVACESARDGEGDLDALYAARDRLRDAGDAFSAAVAQIAAVDGEVGGVESHGVAELKAGSRDADIDAFFELFRDALIEKYGERYYEMRVKTNGGIYKATLIDIYDDYDDEDDDADIVARGFKVFNVSMGRGDCRVVATILNRFREWRKVKYPSEKLFYQLRN